MQLVYAAAVVHDLEPAHHETRDTCLVSRPHSLLRRVVLSPRLTLLGLHLTQTLESPLQCLHVVLSLLLCLGVRKQDLLRVWSQVAGLSRLLQQLGEVRNQIVEGYRPDVLDFDGGDSSFAESCDLEEDLSEDLVHAEWGRGYV